MPSLKRFWRYTGVISAVSGMFLVVLGIVIYRDALSVLTALFEHMALDPILE